MSAELQAAERAPEVDRDGEAGALELARPNLSGDLPTLFEAAPMFRRALAGYDRFQVDTYAQWAEHELATADRERNRLLARYLSTQAALDEARALLSHSAGGGQFVEVSQRIGSMLAAATDQAESIRAEADAARAAAEARAADVIAAAERSLAEATATAERTRAEAAEEAGRTVAEAGVSAEQLLDEARRAAADVRAAAAARLEQVRAAERHAAEQIADLQRRNDRELSAAREQARADVVQLLGAGRDQRLRADAEAAARRERADQEAAARRAWLLAEVDALELRRAALQADVDELAKAAAERPIPTPGQRPDQRGGRFSRWAAMPSLRSSLR